MKENYGDLLSSELDSLKRLNDYHFVFGIISTKAPRKEKKDKANNAEILKYLSMGSKVHKMKARPILDYTIEDIINKKMIDEFYADVTDGVLNKNWKWDQVERCAKQWAIRFENYMKELIRNRDPRIAPNKASTIKRKGSDLPLIDTGQLSRSLVCIFCKKEEYN